MQQVRIDFDNPGLPQSLGVVEGESQSRIFQAALYKSGAAYTAPAGAVYSIMYRGFGPQNQGWYDTIEDGAGKRAACTVSGNVVTCELARQALRVPGHLTVVLCVSDAKGYMLKSWPIMADVRNDGYEDTGEIEMYFNLSGLAGNYLTQLEKAIANAETTKNTLTSTSEQVQKDIDAKAAAALESIPEEYTELDGSVKQLKEDLGSLSVIRKSKNLINPDVCVIGKRTYINGVIYEQATDFYTELIAVKEGEKLYSGFNGTSFNKVQMRHVCAYDSSKNAIPSLGAENPSYSYTVPSGVYFIVATFINTHPERCSLTIGDSLPSDFIEYFKPYLEPVDKHQVEQNKKDILETKIKVNENSSSLTFLNDNRMPISNTSKGMARKYNKGAFRLWKKPSEYDFSMPFDVFSDGNSFKTDFNPEAYKNNYQNVKYLSPNGNDADDGSYEHPWKTFAKIAELNKVTCYLLGGIYTLDNFTNWDGRFYKNFDLIGLGDVKIINGDCPSNWILDDGVYKVALKHNYNLCIDIDTDASGIIYTEVEHLADCKSTKCSFYKGDGFIYVNTALYNPNKKIALLFNDMSECFFIYAHAYDTTPYIKNIKWYGSPNSMLKDTPSVKFVSFTAEVGKSKAVFDNCGFYCGYVGVQTNQLAETIFYECEAANVYTDGFQYFGKSKNIEIKCKGYSCGLSHIQADGQFDNGSTAHEECSTVRINSIYYDNNGGNCADSLDNNAFSLCIGCSAFDSAAEVTSQGFALQGGKTSRMYLESCTAFGNKYDIQSGANGTIKIKNCESETTSENGGVIETIN